MCFGFFFPFAFFGGRLGFHTSLKKLSVCSCLVLLCFMFNFTNHFNQPEMGFVVRGSFEAFLMRFKCAGMKEGCLFWQKAMVSLVWDSQLNNSSIIQYLVHQDYYFFNTIFNTISRKYITTLKKKLCLYQGRAPIVCGLHSATFCFVYIIFGFYAFTPLMLAVILESLNVM